MSIARGLTKAAKAAKKQSRGLTGNRNSQGDFMPEDIAAADFKEVASIDAAHKAAVKNFSNEELKQLEAKLSDALDEGWYDNTPEGVAKTERLKERLSYVEEEIAIRTRNTEAERWASDEPELPPEDYYY
jgi:hypothetical protein